MDTNSLGSLMLIVVSVALLLFGIHGIKVSNQRKKMWERFLEEWKKNLRKKGF